MYALLASFLIAAAAALTGLVQFALRAHEVKATGPWISTSATNNANGCAVEIRNAGDGPALHLAMKLSPGSDGVACQRSVDVLGAGQAITLEVTSTFISDFDVQIEFRDRLGRYHQAYRRMGRGSAGACHVIDTKDSIRARVSGRWKPRLTRSWLS